MEPHAAGPIFFPAMDLGVGCRAGCGCPPTSEMLLIHPLGKGNRGKNKTTKKTNQTAKKSQTTQGEQRKDVAACDMKNWTENWRTEEKRNERKPLPCCSTGGITWKKKMKYGGKEMRKMRNNICHYFIHQGKNDKKWDKGWCRFAALKEGDTWGAAVQGKKLFSGIKWGKTLSLYPREKVKQNKRNSGRSGKKKESPPWFTE